MMRQKRPFSQAIDVEGNGDTSANEGTHLEHFSKHRRSSNDMCLLENNNNIVHDNNNNSDSNTNINGHDPNGNCSSERSFNDINDEESQGVGLGGVGLGGVGLGSGGGGGNGNNMTKNMSNWGVPYCLLLPNRAIGFVIGKNGSNVKEIEKMCEATIKCQRDFDISVSPPPSEKRLTIWGLRENKKKALELILEKSKSVMDFKEDNGREAIVIIVPPRSVPFLIGHKGNKISELCEKSSCEIQIHKEEVAGIKDKAVIIKSKKTSKIIDCIVMIYDFLETIVGGGVISMQDFPGFPKSGLMKRGNSGAWNKNINDEYMNEGSMGQMPGGMGGNGSIGKSGYGNTRGNNFSNYSNGDDGWKEGWKDSREGGEKEGSGVGGLGGNSGYNFSLSERESHDNMSRVSNDDYSCQEMDNFNVPPERNLLLHKLGRESSACVVRFVLDVETTAWVIGRAGCHIKLIRATTGAGAAVVDAPDNIENVKPCDRILTLSGSPVCKYNALKLIVKEMEKRLKNVNNPMRMLVPGKAASFLIGKKGAIIKNITEQSGSQIQVAKNNLTNTNNEGSNMVNSPGNNEKLVLISGTPQAKLLASVLVLHKLEEYENPTISRERLTLPLNELVSNSEDDNFTVPFTNLDVHNKGGGSGGNYNNQGHNNNTYGNTNNSNNADADESYPGSYKNAPNFRKGNSYQNRYGNNNMSGGGGGGGNYSSNRNFHQNNKMNNSNINNSVSETMDQLKNTYKNVNNYKRDSGNNHFSSNFSDNSNKFTHHSGGGGGGSGGGLGGVKGSTHNNSFGKGTGYKSGNSHNNIHNNYHNYSNNNNNNVSEGEDTNANAEFLKEIFKYVPAYALPKILAVKQPCTIELNMPNVYLSTLDDPNKYGKPLIEEISDRSGCNISISTESGGSSFSYTFNLSITGPPLSNSLAILMIQAKIFKFDWF